MGQMLIRTITASTEGAPVGCVERRAPLGRAGRRDGDGRRAAGRDRDRRPAGGVCPAQAVIDFTAPAATVEFAALAAQARAVHVIGTTGLEPAHLARLSAARHAVIVRRAT
jgi:4-hydroxy-tetrahydrodipicolinate reductase